MIRFDDVTFTYPDANRPALAHLSFELAEDAFVVVTGMSGAGKSTLLRCLNGLVPHFSGGTIAGEIRVNDLNPIQAGPEVMCRHVGFVFQDPEAQFVMDRVEDEIAFALENAAIPFSGMQQRVEEALTVLDLVLLRRRALASLSGGEKQRVAIAAALALRPQILVLDEPTSQLDAESAEDVLQSLAHLNAEQGLGVILAEHRLERVLPFATHVLHLSNQPEGFRLGAPAEVLQTIDLAPPVTALGKMLGWSPLPLTVEEGRPFADAVQVEAVQSQPPRVRSSPPHLIAENLTVAYNGRPVVQDVDLALHPGEVTVLMGRNGAGKSTLLKALVGLVRPRQGVVRLEGHDTADMEVAEICRDVAYLPQDPNALLFADTVRQELEITLHNHRMSPAEAPIAPETLLAHLGLRDKATAYPRDLSVGERQRVALAAVMVTAPGVILLDEPTRGLDYAAKAQLLALIHTWRDGDRAVLLVTHDVELAAAAADRLVIMEEGQITTEGAPDHVFEAASSFAPQIMQLFPNTGWLTVNDVRAALHEHIEV